MGEVDREIMKVFVSCLESRLWNIEEYFENGVLNKEKFIEETGRDEFKNFWEKISHTSAFENYLERYKSDEENKEEKEEKEVVVTLEK